MVVQIVSDEFTILLISTLVHAFQEGVQGLTIMHSFQIHRKMHSSRHWSGASQSYSCCWESWCNEVLWDVVWWGTVVTPGSGILIDVSGNPKGIYIKVYMKVVSQMPVVKVVKALPEKVVGWWILCLMLCLDYEGVNHVLASSTR